MRARLTALLLALGLAVGLGLAAQPAATADAAQCGTGYTRVWHHDFTNHQLNLYRKGTGNDWCSIFNATNGTYGVPHYMGIILSADEPISCVDSDGDAGTFSYYAGPVKISCGTIVRMVYQWTSPGGNHFSGSFTY